MTDTPDPAYQRQTAAIPAYWPTAWRHLYRPIRDRALFVLCVIVLTTIGLIVAGDPAAQWWAIALPLVLLIGPLTKPPRARMALHRAVRTGRVRTLPGRLITAERPTVVWLQPATGAPELPLHAGPVDQALRRYVGSAALLVWTRRRRAGAALVLPDRAVVYLVRPPGGVRAAAAEPEFTDEAGWALPIHR